MRPNEQPSNQPSTAPQSGRTVDGFVLPHVQPRHMPRPHTPVTPAAEQLHSRSLDVTTGGADSQLLAQKPAHAAHTPETHYDHQLPAPARHELLEAHVAGIDLSQPAATEKKRSPWKWVLICLGVVLLLTAGGAVAGYGWYQTQLSPVTDQARAQKVRVTIEPGSSPKLIGQLLQQKGLIRDATAFTWYVAQTGANQKLQAGSYMLSSGESVAQIVEHLASGRVDELEITFLPGATVQAHKEVLINAGYERAEVDVAFAKSYTHPVMAGKPAGAGLEGYVYGETYRFSSAASVEDILTRTFDELQAQVTKYGLVDAYKKRNLTLYEGITLASIVQREVSAPEDMKQVAQVFYKRLREGISLGADATFVYAAKKEGKTPSVDFPSPYNTRINKGLPPGPISSPSVSALQAVAAPASGDYLYFVSGDDGRNHFSKTLAEHEAKTRQFCKQNCSLF